MKISHENYTFATESSVKNTAAGKIVRLMANILLFPVSPKKLGKYELTIKSWRYFFCCLLWCIPPSINEAYMMYQDFKHGIPSEAGFTKISSLVFVQLGSITALLNYWVLKVCEAYLVEQCGSIPLLLLPSRKVQLIMFVVYSFAVILYCILYFTGLNQFLVPVNYFFVSLELISSLFLMNVFTTNFVHKCKNLGLFTDIQQLLKESKGLSNAYMNLKKGLGPILLFHYSTSLLLIMYRSYDFVMKFKLLMMADIIRGVFIIWNITSISQECFEELQNANNVLRYKISPILCYWGN